MSIIGAPVGPPVTAGFVPWRSALCPALLCPGPGKGELALLVWESLMFSPGVCFAVGLSCFCELRCVDSTHPVSIITCSGKCWFFSSGGVFFSGHTLQLLLSLQETSRQRVNFLS